MKKRLLFICILLMALCKVSVKAQTLLLNPSNYNGYNVSCFGGNNGSIDLTISGGTAPYVITWSTGAITEDISNLRAGYYRVSVDDANLNTPPVDAEITLKEPSDIVVSNTPYEYPNHFN